MREDSETKRCSHIGCATRATLITWLPDAIQPRIMNPALFCDEHLVEGKKMLSYSNPNEEQKA
jgi:hypothetical protein